MTQTPTVPSQQDGNPLGPNEAVGTGMVAPGQEALAEEFLREQGLNTQEQGERLLAGKFRTQEEMERGYLELQRRFSRGRKEDPQAPEPEPEAAPPAYSREAGVEAYGEALADKFDAAGFDPFELNRRLQAGEVELAAAAKELAAVSDFSEAIAEQFLRGGLQAAPAAQGELDEQAQGEIMGLVGGQESFEDVSKWARDGGVPADRLQAYNDAVESGNRAAVEGYLLWMAAAMELQRLSKEDKALVEPTLVTGSTPAAKGFTTRSEVFAAMRKTDERGNRLYDIDPAYRAQVESLIDKSDLI